MNSNNNAWLRARREELSRRLEAEDWQEVRQRLWECAGGLCEWCLERRGADPRAGDSHHLNYNILWKELEGDNLDGMALLCRDCHLSAHPQHRLPTTPAEMDAMLREFLRP